MTRKLILYAYFLCGCFAVSKLQSQGRAKDDFFFSDRPHSEDSLGTNEDSAIQNDRMKSEAFVFSDSFQHKIELEKTIRESTSRLEKMLDRIQEKQRHLLSLHDKGILTRTELDEKNKQIDMALVKCDELRFHIEGAKSYLSELTPGQ